MNVIALIPAAGTGSRLGAPVHKAFVSYRGRPLVWHTLDRLSEVPGISRMVMALHAHDLPLWKQQEGFEEASANWKPLTVIAGGATRAHSVGEALAEALQLEESEGFLACIHDAARPHASVDLITATLASAAKTGAGVAALPVTDTIKQVGADGQLTTLVRDTLKAMQTPQVIRADWLKKAYELWKNSGEPAVTDDIQMIEPLGRPVAVVPGDPANIKVTFPADLR